MQVKLKASSVGSVALMVTAGYTPDALVDLTEVQIVALASQFDITLHTSAVDGTVFLVFAEPTSLAILDTNG